MFSDMSPVSAFYISQYKFMCRYCEKRFARRLHLDDHERIHTGEKPYRCQICKQGFAQKTNLKTHMRKMHNEHLLWVVIDLNLETQKQWTLLHTWYCKTDSDSYWRATHLCQMCIQGLTHGKCIKNSLFQLKTGRFCELSHVFLCAKNLLQNIRRHQIQYCETYILGQYILERHLTVSFLQTKTSL